MVNWPEVLPLLRSQGLECVADEIEKMRTLLDQSAMTISDLKQLNASESAEVETKELARMAALKTIDSLTASKATLSLIPSWEHSRSVETRSISDLMCFIIAALSTP